MNILSLIASSSFIIYNKVIAHNTSVNAGILVAHFASVYEFAFKTNSLHLGEWFFCTSDDTFEHTALKSDKQDGAIKILLESGLLEKKIMGVPAKRYFRFTNNFEEVVLSFCSKNKFPEKRETEKNKSKSNTSLQVSSKQVSEKTVNQFPEKRETIYNRINNNRINNYIRNNISENSSFFLNFEKFENFESLENSTIINQTTNTMEKQEPTSERTRIGFSFGNSTLTENQTENKPDKQQTSNNIVCKQNNNALSDDYATIDVLPTKKTNKRNSSLKVLNLQSSDIQTTKQNEKPCLKPCLITDSVYSDSLDNGYLQFDADFTLLDKTNTVKPFQFDYVDTYLLWESMITSSQALGSKGYKYTNFISAARNWARMAENRKHYETYLKSDDVMYPYIISMFLEKFNKDTHQITAREKMFAVKLVERVKREKSPDMPTQKAIDNLLFHAQFGLISHIQREKSNPSKEKVFSHFCTFEAMYNNFSLIKTELVNAFNLKKQQNEQR